MMAPRTGRTTVSVPRELEPLFRAAQAAVEAYFGEKLEDAGQGTIAYSGERYILVRAASVSVDFFDLVASLYADRGPREAREVTRNLLYDLAHALGKSDAAAFGERMDLRDPVARLSAGPILFSFTGWAFVSIHPDSSPTPDQGFFLHYDHPYSFESDAWRRRGRMADFPVCVMSAGYSSGWCEECFGLPLAAVEVECVARGDARCRFVMAPPGRIAEHLSRLDAPPGGPAPRAPTPVPEFFLRKRQEEERAAELARANAALEAELGDRRRAEAALRESEERLRVLTDHLPGGMIYQVEVHPAAPRRFRYVSGGVLQAHGVTPEAVYADAGVLYGQIVEEDAARVAALEEAALRENRPFTAEARFRLPSGELRWRFLGSAPRREPDGTVVWNGIELDVTDRKLAEEEREKLEDRLRHSQRLEAIGQLAGGVAHDFNNLLTAIAGNLSVALAEVPPGELHDCLADARRAADSAASLTRQLLAFSRKQPAHARVLDLNEAVLSLQRMLRRLLREDVALRLQLSEGLGRVRADPGQLEQVLVNLVVNARDALPGGGTITLVTRDVALSEQDCRALPGLRPGAHVLLAVSDDGIGMSDAVKARVFEPFFTTKEKGKGTGLGLATVYGVVRQAGGAVDVDSRLGEGTTVRIHLPRVDGEAERPRPAPAAARTGGSETIALVEDNDIVRTFAARILRREGYRVLDFRDGESALEALSRLQEPLHLLVTDVVMPRMSGRLLADRARSERPGLRVLFTSGYTEEELSVRGASDPGSDFLAKPYTRDDLAGRVRELLDLGRTQG